MWLDDHGRPSHRDVLDPHRWRVRWRTGGGQRRRRRGHPHDDVPRGGNVAPFGRQGRSMTGGAGPGRVPFVSTLMGIGSITATVLLILVLDAMFVVTGDRTVDGGRTLDDYVLIVPVLNATAILQSVIGALIERRRT